MSILSKLWTAVRGSATETGQAIVDTQALRILDQEIRDAENALGTARDELAKIIARRTMNDGKVRELDAKIAEYEGHAIRALDKGDESLANDVAQRISQWENERATLGKLADEGRAAESRMRSTITTTESRIQALKSEIDSVKATEAVQAAQAAIASRHAGVNTALGNATNSLERIKQRQAESAARMAAADEMDRMKTGADLDDRLSRLGITAGSTSGNDVLARLRGRTQPQLSGPATGEQHTKG